MDRQVSIMLASKFNEGSVFCAFHLLNIKKNYGQRPYFLWILTMFKIWA